MSPCNGSMFSVHAKHYTFNLNSAFLILFSPLVYPSSLSNIIVDVTIRMVSCLGGERTSFTFLIAENTYCEGKPEPWLGHQDLFFPFHIYPSVRTVFLCLFILFNFGCSHAQVYERALVQEFISYFYSELYLFFLETKQPLLWPKLRLSKTKL